MGGRQKDAEKKCWAGKKQATQTSEGTSQLAHNRPPTNNTRSIFSVAPVTKVQPWGKSKE